MRASFWNILEPFILVATFYSDCGDKNKTRISILLLNHFFQIAQGHGCWIDLKASINFHKKQCLSVITFSINKIYLSKQVVKMTYTLKKRFFGVANFEGL